METDGQRTAAAIPMTRERAESLFGAIGAALVAIYAIGFLILSLYDARFGIVELDPFRARILATGAAFVCLLVLPVAALRYGFTKLPVLDPITRPGEPRLERSRKTILLCAFIYTAWVMAFSLWLLVFPTAQSAPSPWPYRAEASVALLFFFISFSAIVKHFPARPGRCVALALLSAALFYVAMQNYGAIGDLTIWFFS